jgi:hypothetical protein
LSQIEAYAIAEWTPRPWISLGTGAGVDHMSSGYVVNPGCGTTGSGACSSPRADWTGVSVPLLIGFNFGCPHPERPRHSALRLGLEGAGGVEPSTGINGWHTGVAFGGAWM